MNVSIEVMIIAGVSATVALIQIVVLVRLSRAVGRVERIHERLQQFGGALELLTDTTETGFAQVASAMERPTRRAPSKSSRSATVRRISSAVKQGHRLEDIAAAEGLSEGEVRLHLQMVAAQPAAMRA
jgi:Flp pilus assembly protein TadB